MILNDRLNFWYLVRLFWVRREHPHDLSIFEIVATALHTGPLKKTNEAPEQETLESQYKVGRCVVFMNVDVIAYFKM